MKDLVANIVKSLVDYPDQVTVTETTNEDKIQVEVRVAEDDIGKVIGRQGKIANSIRTIAKAAGTKRDKKVFIDILDDFDD